QLARDQLHSRLKDKPGVAIEEEAFRRAEYHTFDLLVLQRVGKAALLLLNGQETQVIADIKSRYPNVEPSDLTNSTGTGTLQQLFFNPAFQYTMFLFLFVGFAIKVPLFPFHTWLPDAHVEAPTPISMILAG